LKAPPILYKALLLNLFQIIHPESLAHCQEQFSRVISGESIDNIQATFFAKDGRPVYVEGNATGRYLDGEIVATHGFFRDITEHKQAEDALRQSEQKYRQLVENLREGIWVIDKDSCTTFVNPSMAEMLGYKTDEMLGRQLFSFMDERGVKIATQLLARRREGVHEQHDFEFLRKDGTRVYFSLGTSPITDKDGNYIGAIAGVQDITERRKMEKLLRDNEEKFSMIFYANPTPMIIISMGESYINDVNEAFIQHSGYTREECIGNMVDNLKLWVSPDEQKEFMRMLSKYGRVASMDIQMHLKSGETRMILLSAEIITLAGKLYRIISTRDITELKKMEAQLIVTDRLASIGELSAGIAHEMNNPLTGVIGFSGLLLERNDIPDDIREDLTLINKEAKRTANVVKNLLTFARRHDTEREPTDINKIIQNVLELRTYEQKVHNIEVKASFAADLPEINADAFKLQQVFINIIINAEYFMIESHGRGIFTITTEKQGDIIRASFADDGPGITPENLKHIFDPFYTTKEVGKGTGLGLSICYGIITEHGGRIWAESEAGKGATFIIEMPLNAK
jgi:two-component system NtrC family sensor kinase